MLLTSRHRVSSGLPSIRSFPNDFPQRLGRLLPCTVLSRNKSVTIHEQSSSPSPLNMDDHSCYLSLCLVYFWSLTNRVSFASSCTGTVAGRTPVAMTSRSEIPPAAIVGESYGPVWSSLLASSSAFLCPRNGFVHSCLDSLDDAFDYLSDFFHGFGGGFCTVCTLTEGCVQPIQGWSDALGLW